MKHAETSRIEFTKEKDGISWLKKAKGSGLNMSQKEFAVKGMD